MQKFGFRIQTRSGLVVENLVIHAADQTMAEQRLKQMYIGCKVLESKVFEDSPPRSEVSDLEGVINLITNQDKK
jgi:hypothetical protein